MTRPSTFRGWVERAVDGRPRKRLCKEMKKLMILYEPEKQGRGNLHLLFCLMMDDGEQNGASQPLCCCCCCCCCCVAPCPPTMVGPQRGFGGGRERKGWRWTSEVAAVPVPQFSSAYARVGRKGKERNGGAADIEQAGQCLGMGSVSRELANLVAGSLA